MQNLTQKTNKRGLSDVLTSVLLIMLSVAAIAILGLAINKFLISPQLSPQFSCIDLQTSQHLSAESVCFNATTTPTAACGTKSFPAQSGSKLVKASPRANGTALAA